MTEPITPALTPEQWKHAEFAMGETDELFAYVVSGLTTDEMRLGWNAEPMRPITPDQRHALAALALYGQDFGFTQEDVTELRDVAVLWTQEAAISDEHLNGLGDRDEDRGIWGKNAESCRRRAATTRSIADRIAALLPPTP